MGQNFRNTLLTRSPGPTLRTLISLLSLFSPPPPPSQLRPFPRNLYTAIARAWKQRGLCYYTGSAWIHATFGGVRAELAAPHDAMIDGGGGSTSLFKPSPPRFTSMTARAPSSLHHGKPCGLCDAGEHIEPHEIWRNSPAPTAMVGISRGITPFLFA